MAEDEDTQGISLSAVSFGYSSVPVLDQVTFEVPRGSTVVVAGTNGSGKSTLLYVCAGLLEAQLGTVSLGGHQPDKLTPSDLMRLGIRRGVVFQEGGLLSNMNALANVALPMHYHADLLDLSPSDIEETAKQILERVGLSEDETYSLPAHLSFGVRKRLALARAIAVKPNFFYFDDPDVGLDPKTAALIHEILCTYRDDPEVTMLVSTNRDLLIERLGVPGYRLERGRVRPLEPPFDAPLSLRG